jgi:hypothetical protein
MKKSKTTSSTIVVSNSSDATSNTARLSAYPIGIDGYWDYQKDYSVLKEFTDEELSLELLRRTSLGKELE